MKGNHNRIMPVLFELKDLMISGITAQLNLQLKPGMTVFLVTASDEERDLLLQTLLGEQIPVSGSVLFAEQNLHSIDRNDLLKIRREIGTVAARTNLISNLKLWENITLPCIYHNGSLAPETTDQVMRLLEVAGLHQNIWALPGHLSAAERIMTAFIRAVITAPKLLLLAACLDDLPDLQQKSFLHILAQVQSKNDAPALLFITTGMFQLLQLQPDVTIDLRQNPALVTRRS